MDKNQQAFFELAKVGLFPVHGDRAMNDSLFEDVDWETVYQLAQEQSVQGLVLQGIEELRAKNLDLRVPQALLLQWIGEVQMIEQRNQAMNEFVAKLIEQLRHQDVYAILVKGQGIAQCYEKPLWRAAGDVDLFLSKDNYNRAKSSLIQLASHVEMEREDTLHLGMTIDSWVVELHGSLRCGLSKRLDKGLDDVQEDIICGGSVRSSMIGGTQVFLPRADEDAIYVFTHILEHFYKGGIGLRQICDWCRLLWTYRASIHIPLLEKRLKQMGLQTQWKGFGAFAVNYLGMPLEAMPLYSSDKNWPRKAKRICDFVLKVGNFGHNRDNSYYAKYPFLIRKIYSFGRRCGDLLSHARIFPMYSIRFFPSILFYGMRSAVRGEWR